MIDLQRITAIDPYGCGCTECLVGEYVPLDSPFIQEVVEAVWDGRIAPRNNLNEGTLIVYRSNGSVHWTTNSQMRVGTDYFLVGPNEPQWYGEITVDISTVEDVLAGMDDEQEISEVHQNLWVSEGAIENPTDSLWIVYRTSYGECGTVELPYCVGQPQVLFAD